MFFLNKVIKFYSFCNFLKYIKSDIIFGEKVKKKDDTWKLRKLNIFWKYQKTRLGLLDFCDVTGDLFNQF